MHTCSRNLKYTIILMLMMLNMVSCKKFLEEPVDNRTMITTLPDMEKTLNTMLPYSDYHFTDLMTDDYIFRDLSGHIVESTADITLPIFELAITRNHPEQAQFLPDGFNPVVAFRRYYYRIINTLLLIKKANAYQAANEQEEERKQNIIGKAMAIKAYCNYMLVNLFAKQYDPATANQDMGIPFVEQYNGEAIVPYFRVSVQKIYEAIEADLLESLSLVSDEGADNTVFSFNKDAMLALLSRVYLNKKDWDNCIKYADMLLERRSAVLNIRKIRAEFNDYAEFSNQYFNPGNPAYILMGGNTYQLIAYFFTGMYAYPAMQLMKENNADSADNYRILTSPLFNDFVPQKFGKFFTLASRYFNMPLFTVDEVYFNRAEATIEKNNGMTQSVINDLSVLIDNQNFTSAETDKKKNELRGTSSRISALEKLLLLKRLRFSSEGMRWFDMRRHRIPVEHTGRSGTYKIDGTNPDAYVIKLPLEEITRNTGVE